MKKLFMVMALMAIAGTAHAEKSGSISCATKRGANFNYTLEADTLQLWDEEKDEARMVAVTMTAASGRDAKETGRAKYVSGQKNPRARKYKDFFKFDMDALTDTKDFGKFQPIDQCSIHVMIPDTFFKKSSFEAPVVTNCDQNGGSVTMNCEYKADRD